MILPVAELERDVDFFTSILGCTYEGESAPFSVIRVTPDLTLQLAPWGTEGGVHLAFALPRAEFDAAFCADQGRGHPLRRLVPRVGNMQGPGDEDGVRGPGAEPLLLRSEPAPHRDPPLQHVATRSTSPAAQPTS